MKKLIVIGTIAVLALVVLPYAFRFDPEKLYFFACFIGCALLYRRFASYLVKHWNRVSDANSAPTITSFNIVIQAIALCGGVFVAVCFVAGMLFTQFFGDSAVLRGKVTSARTSRYCLRDLSVALENGKHVHLCTRTPYAAGSDIAVRVRNSFLGRYVE